MNFYLIEHLARVLCESHGGKWNARKHKRQVWRDRVFEMLAKEERRQLVERKWLELAEQFLWADPYLLLATGILQEAGNGANGAH